MRPPSINNRTASSRMVTERDLLAKLKGEFPSHQLNLSRGERRGECSLSVSGADVRTVYRRAQVLACIALLYNSTAFLNRRLRKTRWWQYASLSTHNRNHSRLQFRRDDETISFHLEPVGRRPAGSSLSLYLREL